jgi:hypothetical protein
MLFDKAIYYADPKAVTCTALPNWFMTLVSFYGLGAQLLLMALFLVLNGIDVHPSVFHHLHHLYTCC